jgi:hypothetical protein
MKLEIVRIGKLFNIISSLVAVWVAPSWKAVMRTDPRIWIARRNRLKNQLVNQTPSI